jgi:hypothetical protein
LFVFTFAQTPFITFKAKENYPLEGGFSFELGMGLRRPVQAASVFLIPALSAQLVEIVRLRRVRGSESLCPRQKGPS